MKFPSDQYIKKRLSNLHKTSVLSAAERSVAQQFRKFPAFKDITQRVVIVD